MIGKEELAMATLDALAVASEHPSSTEAMAALLQTSGFEPRAAMGWAVLFADQWLEVQEIKGLDESQTLKLAIAEAFVCGARAARAERLLTYDR